MKIGFEPAEIFHLKKQILIVEREDHELELGKKADFEGWNFTIRDTHRADAAGGGQYARGWSSLRSSELGSLNTQHLGRHCQRRGDVKQ